MSSVNMLQSVTFPDTHDPWILALLLFAVLFVGCLLHRPRKYPPGPRGLPLVGNLFDLGGDSWLTFTRWKSEYGPIVYLSVAGQSVVVLNSHKAATDLLERRASLYSDRPRNIVASEILTRGLLLVFANYGDLWRRMRRAAHEGMNRSAAQKFHATQASEAILLVRGMLDEPDSWELHLRRATASTILSIVYGTNFKSVHDPSLGKINNFVERVTRAAYPGAHLVEFVTWMKYLPRSIAKWKRDAEEWFLKDAIMFKGLYEDVEKRVNNGGEWPSFSTTLVETKDRHGLGKTQCAYLAGTMYAAGAETTSAVVAWFIHAMLLYPEVQKKAQEELDAIVGRTRLPAFADIENLPYIRALVRESLRFRAVDPIGIPHRLIQDDYYDGYLIPAGTTVMVNVWGLNRDPEVHGPDVDTFNPARYLDEGGRLAPAPVGTKEEGHVSYGFGRRICVGRYIANNSLFIDIAMILWALTLTPSKDMNGYPVLPLVDKCVNDGLVVRPVPFKCSIMPRFPEALAILSEPE